MQRLRSTRWKGILAVLLGISLMPLVTAPLAQAMQPSHAPLYADWLGKQIHGERTPALQIALDKVASGKAKSLQVFLLAFAEAYEAQDAGTPLADAFPLEGQSREEVIQYLYSRYGLALGGVPVAKATFDSATPSILGALGRAMAILPHVKPNVIVSQSGKQGLRFENSPHFPLRLRSAARPLGP